ncbi:MAG: hypothetical protein HYI21_00015 [Sediminibacterium sp. Gen4]|uniref:hypothetical protein n=1 Tax=Sediminibacterium sp. Gen4 TaxID=2736285 RepID=UPI0015BC2248|nr:hypothetical protein [Sediminibacterium sp. Gen4]MBW0162641.1 hypothetical protein [Sediminibacterium sp.]MBW0164936.1 hypothetical protein [Sediminibacterium sp.]NWK64391.1 hypothetical protein [Sediminibacterium sp. Gen4]
MRKIYLLILFSMNSICCLSQSDIKDFLFYFLNHYLPSKGLHKINDKSNHAFFAQRYSILTNRIEVVMKRDTSKEIRSITKQFLEHIRSSNVNQSYQDLFSPNQLFGIDSFYAADSIIIELEKKYTKAVRDSQGGSSVYSMPLQTKETPSTVKLQVNQAFKTANDFIKQAVEITVPYFFNNGKNCLIIYVRHLNYWPEAKVLLFQKSGNDWSFKRVIFDQQLFLDDEASPYLRR